MTGRERPIDREISCGGDFNTGTPPPHYGLKPLPLERNSDVRIDLTNSTVNHVFTLTPRGSTGGSYTYTLKAGGVRVFHGDGLSKLSIDSADANAQWEKAPAGTFDGEASPGSPNLVDAAGNPYGQSFANGGTAPATGVGRALVGATATDPITLSDGTSTIQITVMAATAQWFLATFPVIQGKTYTFAGTGLVLLGPGIVVSPS